MKKNILIILLTLSVLALGFVGFIYSGIYNISTVSHHNAITLWVINTLRDNSIERRDADITVPNLNDTTLIKQGFEHYAEMCVGCHAAPGINQGEVVQGFYPIPPKIYKFANKVDPKETFWIIKNGIKMTAMPGFGKTHSDKKIWAMTAFIKQKLGNMTAGEFKQWVQNLSAKEKAEQHNDDDDK